MKQIIAGLGFKLTVQWYDNVPEPKRNQTYQGEVVGWRNSQVIVRVKDYAVLRFWKRSGTEVGNADHARRGFRLDLAELNPSAAAPKTEPMDLSILQTEAPGVSVSVALDTDA